MDRTFVEFNQAATERIRRMGMLSEKELQHPVGQHWTLAITLAHLGFWDRRVMYVLDMTERDKKLFVPEIDVYVNDLFLPFWAAIPPKEAARIGLESAEAVDKRLASFPEDLLEEVLNYNRRWVFRGLHRNGHLDEAEAALRG